MRMIDMHCDTLWKLIDLDGQGDLMKNDCHISIPSMKKREPSCSFLPVLRRRLIIRRKEAMMRHSFMYRIWCDI